MMIQEHQNYTFSEAVIMAQSYEATLIGYSKKYQGETSKSDQVAEADATVRVKPLVAVAGINRHGDILTIKVFDPLFSEYRRGLPMGFYEDENEMEKAAIRNFTQQTGHYSGALHFLKELCLPHPLSGRIHIAVLTDIESVNDCDPDDIFNRCSLDVQDSDEFDSDRIGFESKPIFYSPTEIIGNNSDMISNLVAMNMIAVTGALQV